MRLKVSCSLALAALPFRVIFGETFSESLLEVAETCVAAPQKSISVSVFADDEPTFDDPEPMVDGAEPFREDAESTCKMFLAPSVIPNAGLGVFTTRKISNGEPLISPADAPMVLVTDLDVHQPDGKDPAWSYHDCFWTAQGISQFEAQYVNEFVPNAGSLCNYHTYLLNVQPVSEGYDDSLLSRFQDPGAGAFSYYKGERFIASRDIDAGEEIFADYGTSWLETRKGTFADSISRYADFTSGAMVLETVMENLKGEGKIDDSILATVHSVVSIFDQRVALIIPTTKAQYDQSTSTASSDAISLSLAWSTVKNHTVEWIEANGMCLDNIMPGISTIRQAGHGAFARRFLPKDSMVAPVPLFQIPQREVFVMYNIYVDTETNKRTRVEDEIIGEQLMTNYCFGHEQSSLLLCPTTNAILINHCSAHSIGGDGPCRNGPNARIRWATDWDPKTPEWLELSLQEIDDRTLVGARGLSFEVIATRDILFGEEIFIDYGDDWDLKWTEHVATWERPANESGFESFSPTTEMNKSNFTLRTAKELKEMPYSENIWTGCLYWENEEELLDETEELEEWQHLTDDKIIEQFGIDGENFVSLHELAKEAVYWPCKVYFKEDNHDSKFTVRIFQSSGQSPTSWTERGIPRIVTNYPRESIQFFTKPYKSDQHLPNAFRHHIGIPDEMFPEKWKNLSENEEE